MVEAQQDALPSAVRGHEARQRPRPQGYAFRSRSPDDCDVLSRDACIASPDCALHGSEDFDPGYSCHAAETVCERLDARGCEGLPGLCVFDTGSCYCPEGAVCGCGGGPPPICRRRCDPRTDEVSCTENQYCQLSPGAGGAICFPSFDDGQCVRVPSTCSGAPMGAPPVCGCPQVGVGNGPERYANDCERRRGRAFVVPDAWCTP